MKVCVAQTKPVKGDKQANLQQHLQLISIASEQSADLIVFPELSLTGYEPSLAAALATPLDSLSSLPFVHESNAHNMTIAVGLPTVGNTKPRITLAIFQPQQAPLCYGKQFLFSTEEPYFEPGSNIPPIKVEDTRVGFAICYEISVDEHTEATIEAGAQLYVASVAEFVGQTSTARKRPETIAQRFRIPVLMANCVGRCDDNDCAGESAVWNNRGERLAALDSTNPGVLIYDTSTEQVTTRST